MLIEVLGWASTLLVLIGFLLNARGLTWAAFITWIIGDIGWVTYDVLISNWSHMTLSAVIIAINVYGMINIIRKQKLKLNKHVSTSKSS